LQHSGTSEALPKRALLEQQNRILANELATLRVTTPVSGTVVTPRIEDLVASYVTAGTELAEIADLRTMRARIYVSEYEMYKYVPGAKSRFQVDGSFGNWYSDSLAVSPAPSEIAPHLLEESKLQGMRPPTSYAIDLLVRNDDGRLKPGMVGNARVYGRRRSVAGLIYQTVADFTGRKLW
jgi:multidrug efflux pump subunit AcrA (membrane-fusion protein)